MTHYVPPPPPPPPPPPRPTDMMGHVSSMPMGQPMTFPGQQFMQPPGLIPGQLPFNQAHVQQMQQLYQQQLQPISSNQHQQQMQQGGTYGLSQEQMKTFYQQQPPPVVSNINPPQMQQLQTQNSNSNHQQAYSSTGQMLLPGQSQMSAPSNMGQFAMQQMNSQSTPIPGTNSAWPPQGLNQNSPLDLLGIAEKAAQALANSSDINFPPPSQNWSAPQKVATAMHQSAVSEKDLSTMVQYALQVRDFRYICICS